MIRLVPVAALALGTLLPVPAYAADVDCQEDGGTLTVTLTTSGTVRLGLNAGSFLAVALGDAPLLDCGGKPEIQPGSKTIKVSTTGGATTWVVETTVTAYASVEIANGASDVLQIEGTDAADYWKAPGGPALSLDVSGSVDAAVELTLAGPVAKASFLPDEGDDFVDLSGWTLPAYVDPGEQADAVVGSPGNDSFVIAPDGEPDSIDAGGGFDSLVFDAEDDEPVRYDEDPNVDDGADDDGDDLSDFEVVTGGLGNDTLAAGDVLHDVRGGPGNDVLISGPGNDLLTGGPGFDFVSFRRLEAVVVNGTQATGQGTDTVGDGVLEAVEGSRFADRFLVTTAGATVKPGRGADRVVASVPGVRLLSDDKKDGSDTFTAPRGQGIWDYSLRTKPVRVNAAKNGATDGEPGEEDNVAVQGVIGGKSNDVIIGSRKANLLYGGLGDDTLSGGGGHDRVDGGSGADTISGGGGRDVLLGGSGTDRIDAKDGKKDVVLGGGGRDVARRDKRDKVRQVEGAF